MPNVKPYQLWEVKGKKRTRLAGQFNTLEELSAAWLKHEHDVALEALQIIGDKKININTEMPTVVREVTEFRTAEERDAYIIQHAKYFTIVRFLGVGRYERHEKPTREEAEQLAKELALENRANYIIYAVGEHDYQAFVKTVLGYL